jgi:hypothetical protein
MEHTDTLCGQIAEFVKLTQASRISLGTATNLKIGVFRDVTPCGSCKNGRFGGTYHVHHQGDKNRQLGTTLAVTRNRRTLRRNTNN